MWKTVKLGDVAEIRSGSINPQKHPETLFELYSIPGFDNDQTPERLPGSEIKSNKTRLPHRGVLFSKLNPRINRVWTINEPANAIRISSTEFVCLVPDEKRLDLDFLSWRLRVPNISKQLPVATEVATKSRERIQPKSLLRLHIPLPPLTEQRRIVAKLDAAFVEIDKAQAAAERENDLMNSVFENYLNAAFRKQAFENDVIPLGEVCKLQNGFAFKSSLFRKEGTPVLRISNIQDGEISLNKAVYVHQDDYQQSLRKYLVHRNDLLIAMSGATTGKVGINTHNSPFYLNQRVGLLKPKNELLDRDYLYFFLATRADKNLSISAGAAQPNLSSKQIKETEIPKLPLRQQTEFVADVKRIRQSINDFLFAKSKAIANYRALKSAILARELQSEAA